MQTFQEFAKVAREKRLDGPKEITEPDNFCEVLTEQNIVGIAPATEPSIGIEA